MSAANLTAPAIIPNAFCAKESKKENPCAAMVSKLADAALYLANDFANDFDCARAALFEQLQQSGFISSEVKRHDH